MPCCREDNREHSALDNLQKSPDYHILSGSVISNERAVYQEGKVTYLPVYFVMFMEEDTPVEDKLEYLF